MKQASSCDKIILHINKPTIENLKYFVYRDKRYEIDFQKLKMNCRYFYINRKQFKETDCINLLNEDEESIELTEESIKGFISICQNEKCELSSSTINSIHYLSKKFGFPELEHITNEYIESHQIELCFENLLFKIKTKSNTTNEEKIISKNIKIYIKDHEEEIINLPIIVLYRIFGYYLNSKKVFDNEIIDFLFKILKSKGREASVLFTLIDFKKEKIYIIKRLTEEYSDIFDFNMINSTLAKSLTELTNELIKQKENVSIIFSQMRQYFEDEKNEIKRIKENAEKKEREYEEEKKKLMKEYSKEIETIKNEYEKQMQSIEKRCDRNSLSKYKHMIIEILDLETFKKLSQESKMHIINEIVNEQNQYQALNDIVDFDNIFIERVLFCKKYYEMFLRHKKVIDKQFSINKYIIDNIDHIRSELIEFLHSRNILNQIIQEIITQSNFFYIELQYPMKSFKSISNCILEVIKKNAEYPKYIQIKLLISDEKYFDKNSDINNFVVMCCIETNQETINQSQFSIMPSLNTIEIKGNVNVINNDDESTFKYLAKLKEINFSSLVTTFGNSSFENCLSLTHITIPSSVKTICKNSFKGCTSLNRIFIPSSVTTIGDNAFENCSSLAQIIIPLSVSTICKNLFKGCISLTNISIPQSVCNIYNCAFEGCTKLKQVTIDPRYTKFEKDTFENCTSLKNFIIPFLNSNKTKSQHTKENSLFYLTNINYTTFNEMQGESQLSIISFIKMIKCNFNSNNEKEKIIQNHQKIENLLIFLNKEKKKSYSSKKIQYINVDQEEKSICITNDMIEMLYKNNSLRSDEFLHILKLMQEIYIQIQCSSLNYNDVLEDLKTIKQVIQDRMKICILINNIKRTDNDIFRIDEIISIALFDSSVTEISSNDQSFQNCALLTKIIIPSSVISIGHHAFSECSSLIQIEIPSTVTSIGHDAFSGCSSLEKITIPSSITSIESSTFFGCTSLTQIIIPSSMTSIGNYAFSGCSSLIQIEIPSTVTSIGHDAFSGCSSLEKITIPSSITSIESSTFFGCTLLTQIIIPSSITSIGNYAFSECSSLAQITIHSPVISIYYFAFTKCSSLKQITIPSSLNLNLNEIEIGSNVSIIKL